MINYYLLIVNKHLWKEYKLMTTIYKIKTLLTKIYPT